MTFFSLLILAVFLPTGMKYFLKKCNTEIMLNKNINKNFFSNQHYVLILYDVFYKKNSTKYCNSEKQFFYK